MSSYSSSQYESMLIRGASEGAGSRLTDGFFGVDQAEMRLFDSVGIKGILKGE
jgi:hypothetical protein